MVSKLTFNTEGKGYLYEKVEKPTAPKRGTREYFRVSEDEFNKAIKRYKEELKEWKKHKDDYKLRCSKLLIGRTFNFEPGKINIIFGPNASGKSTIIKAIAGEAFCKDGYTTFLEPLDFDIPLFDNKSDFKFDEDTVRKTIDKVKKNTCDIEWNGYPIYYHNFSNTLKNSHYAGQLMESGLIDDFKDEAFFTLFSSSYSSGQNAAYIFNKLRNVISHNISLEEILKKYTDTKSMNSTWSSCYVGQYEHFSKLENFSKKGEKTLLLDEIDVNLDIETVYRFYTVVLPKLCEDYNTQIIAVSHNPLVLSNDIKNNPIYNIVSIDEEYTNTVLDILRKTKF